MKKPKKKEIFTDNDIQMIVSLIEVGYGMEQIADMYGVEIEDLAKGIKKIFDGATFLDLYREYYVQGVSIPARRNITYLANAGDVKASIFLAKTTGMIEKNEKTQEKPQTQTVINMVNTQ